MKIRVKRGIALLLNMALVVSGVQLSSGTVKAESSKDIMLSSKIVSEGNEQGIIEEYFDLGKVQTSAMSSNLFGLSDGTVDLISETAENWIDRLDLTGEEQVIKEFYNTLVEATDNDGENDYLIADNYFSAENVITVATVTDTMEGTYSEAEVAGYIEEVASEELSKYGRYIRAAYDAFDRDHPEVFWLGGDTLAKYVCSYSLQGEEDAYSVSYEITIDFLLKDENFDIRATPYQSEAEIQAGIATINNRANEWIEAVSAKTIREKITYFNEQLTKTNEYNTSADLNNIGHDCREAISALIGKTGTDGPVCESYARAFKVLCDKAGIPCVLVDGQAKDTPDSSGEAHMWNYVQVDGEWLAVDITWNDLVGGNSGAVSGVETESWLLVYANSEIDGMKFIESHPVTNQPSVNGVIFSNGPQLAETEEIEDIIQLFRVDNVEYRILSDSTVAIWNATEVSGNYEIPSQITYDGISYTVTEVGCTAFYKNTKLTGLVMPDTITKIQDWIYEDWEYSSAFGKCTALESVTFSKNLTYIGKYAFVGNTALKNVVLPDKLESISEGVFADCSGITELVLPDSVTYVGQSALTGTSLKTFTVPKTCTIFHDWALDDISTLTAIYVEPGQGNFCSVDGVMYTSDMSWVANYPKGKTDEEYILPDEVTTIRTNVFSGNPYLKKLILNSKIDAKGLGTAILQRTNISAIEVPADNPHLKSVEGVLFSHDEKTLILYPPAKKDSVYFIPSGTVNIGGAGTYTFEYCQYLEELYIPASVEKMSGIMWNSTKLKQVVIASESKITSIPSSAFYGTALESICLPAGIQSFSDDYYGNEFYNCVNLKILYAAQGAGVYNCEYFGTQSLSGCNAITIYGEGDSNALSQLAEQFGRPYQDVSHECDKVLGITFKDTVRSIKEEETISLDAVVYPAINSDKVLQYTSSNENIANVDEEGNVKGISSGICYITATSQDGAYARCRIQVTSSDINHIHSYGSPIFVWSDDNKACKITYICEQDPLHTVSYDCIVTSKVKTAATCSDKGTTTYTAKYIDTEKLFSAEGKTYTDTKDVKNLGMLAHKEATKVREATTQMDGEQEVYCDACKKTIIATAIPKIKDVVLEYKNTTYTGKKLEPAVVVKDSAGKIISSSNYTVSYTDNKNVGIASVTVKFKNIYLGSVTKTFKISPKGTKIKKLTAISKGFKVTWRKQKNQISGYELQYATNNKFSKKETRIIKITKSNTEAKKVKGLKARKKYYVRVRTYKTVKINGKATKVYSAWSKSGKIMTKK